MSFCHLDTLFVKCLFKAFCVLFFWMVFFLLFVQILYIIWIVIFCQIYIYTDYICIYSKYLFLHCVLPFPLLVVSLMNSFLFYFFIFKLFLLIWKVWERHWLVVSLIYAFIGCFLYVLWWENQACNPGVSGWCSNQLDCPARAMINY